MRIPGASLPLLFELILVIPLASLAQADRKPVTTAPAQLLLQGRLDQLVLQTAEGDGATAPHTELPPGAGGAGEDGAPGAGSEAPGPEGAGCSCHWPPGGDRGEGGRGGGHGGHGGRGGGGGEGSGDGGESECHCGPHGGGGGRWQGGGGSGGGSEGGGGGGGGDYGDWLGRPVGVSRWRPPRNLMLFFQS